MVCTVIREDIPKIIRHTSAGIKRIARINLLVTFLLLILHQAFLHTTAFCMGQRTKTRVFLSGKLVRMEAASSLAGEELYVVYELQLTH